VRYACEHITGPATIYVKHGEYEEVLPIKVPAFVAIVGDELRGTVIKPAPTIIPAQDISVTVDTFNRIRFTLQRVLLGQTVSSNAEVEQIIPETPVTSAEFAIVDQLIVDHVSTLQGLPAPTITSTNTITVDAARLATAEIINDNREFITEDALLFADSISGEYDYKRDKCARDLNLIFDAITYDLTYPGNYKTIEAGKYYANAASGERNALSNMFLLNDGTGLRNMTLRGLRGALTPPLGTEFFNQRPTGGAFASLDPGWGPEDNSVWVGSRSPYVQNVTVFGDACVGLRVDGLLHAGGNKTIVANDFTQIISDGIGSWVNNEGASELVSVFTYYNQIGYLAENGGKIRATNGNNSYGKYGCISDGVNPDEVPIFAEVYNRYFDATVGQVFVSNGQVLKLLFNHAGQNYTQGNINVIGAGIGRSEERRVGKECPM
jgi:hypothetical protein